MKYGVCSSSQLPGILEPVVWAGLTDLSTTGVPFVGLPTGYENRYKPHIGVEKFPNEITSLKANRSRCSNYQSF